MGKAVDACLRPGQVHDRIQTGAGTLGMPMTTLAASLGPENEAKQMEAGGSDGDWQVPSTWLGSSHPSGHVPPPCPYLLFPKPVLTDRVKPCLHVLDQWARKCGQIRAGTEQRGVVVGIAPRQGRRAGSLTSPVF